MELFVEGGSGPAESGKRDRKVVMAVPVYVQCDGFRSLAYRDEAGIWRHFYGGEAIRGLVTPVPYESK